MSLSVKQIKALNALLSGESIAAAAALAGVNEKTVDRWIGDDPDFCEEFHYGKVRLLERGFLIAANHIEEALGIFLSIMRDDEASNRDRISASKALLSEVDHFEKITTLQQIRELEYMQSLVNESDE